jgi:hypothetical protein
LQTAETRMLVVICYMPAVIVFNYFSRFKIFSKIKEKAPINAAFSPKLDCTMGTERESAFIAINNNMANLTSNTIGAIK